MAVSLPTALVTHGNSLMADFRNQGRIIHQLAFQQKHVAAQIQNLIDNFDTHEVMKKPKDTAAVLKEAQVTYQQIKDNIDRLDAKGVELSTFIQQLLERTTKGGEDSKAIQQEIDVLRIMIQSNKDEIIRTKDNLAELSSDLRDLQEKVEIAERDARQSHESVVGWSIATFFTLGVAAIGLQPALKHRQNMYDARDTAKDDYNNKLYDYNQLIALENNYNGDMNRLAGSLRLKNGELQIIQGVLNSLRMTRNESHQCQQFLFFLAHDLTHVNSCVHKMYGYLVDTSEILATNASVPSDNEWRLNQSFQELNETWSAAKEKQALQIALHLVDPNSVDATLRAIKSAQFNERYRRSLETFLIY